MLLRVWRHSFFLGGGGENKFLKDLDRMFVREQIRNRATSFLFQRIAIDIQIGDAASVMGTLLGLFIKKTHLRNSLEMHLSIYFLSKITTNSRSISSRSMSSCENLRMDDIWKPSIHNHIKISGVIKNRL